MDVNDNKTLVLHAGVKGMKWGVRKNKDREARKNEKSEKRAIKKASKQRAKSWNDTYNRRGTMSDQELNRAVQRLRLENEFKRLSVEASASTSRKYGKKYLDQFGNAAVEGVKPVITATVKKATLAAAVA